MNRRGTGNTRTCPENHWIVGIWFIDVIKGGTCETEVQTEKECGKQMFLYAKQRRAARKGPVQDWPENTSIHQLPEVLKRWGAEVFS